MFVVTKLAVGWTDDDEDDVEDEEETEPDEEGAEDDEVDPFELNEFEKL